jgi:peptidoglycan hydrolase-like protein with peptidoglycan-binding domain
LPTHIRLALAAAVAGLALPVAAAADTGGAEYGAAKRAGAPSSARRSPSRPSRGARHLGDRLPIRQGMTGHDVRILQDFFDRIGMRVAVDGSFGHGTWAALRRFEKRVGRPVDGVLDAGDLAALRRIVTRGWGPKLRQSPATPAADPAPLPPGSKARVNPDGTATAPADAPTAVQEIVAAGNEIATKPYRYGGGHGRWNDTGYDCSGSVSFALHGADLLDAPMDSSQLESYGAAGPGRWVTIYANAGHAYMVVAGLRFDTSGRSQAGTRWQADMRSGGGYVVRHPDGL